MRRYIESNNVVLFIVLLEIKRVVALIAVDNKQTYCANSTLLCMRIKVL